MGLTNYTFALFFNLYRSQFGMDVYTLITREPLEDLRENVAPSTKIAEKVLKRNFSEAFVSMSLQMQSFERKSKLTVLNFQLKMVIFD